MYLGGKKKKTMVYDAILSAIANKNIKGFYYALRFNELAEVHLNELHKQNLFCEYISKSLYESFDFQTKDIIYKFIFKYDLDDLFNHLVGSRDLFEWECRSLICKANAFKCLQKLLSKAHPWTFYAFLRKCAIQNSNLEIITYLWNNLTFRHKEMSRRLHKFSSDCYTNQSIDVIEWLVENKFKCTNINTIIKTELERQFLIRKSRSLNWEEASLKLSHESTRQLRSKFTNINDKLLHTKTSFPTILSSGKSYSFLFMQLYYAQQYERMLKNLLGIKGIEWIIQEYLLPFERNEFGDFCQFF